MEQYEKPVLEIIDVVQQAILTGSCDTEMPEL